MRPPLTDLFRRCCGCLCLGDACLCFEDVGSSLPLLLLLLLLAVVSSAAAAKIGCCVRWSACWLRRRRRLVGTHTPALYGINGRDVFSTCSMRVPLFTSAPPFHARTHNFARGISGLRERWYTVATIRAGFAHIPKSYASDKITSRFEKN